MTKDTIRIMSIDPGLTTAGWAVSDYIVADKTLHVQAFGQITAAHFAGLKAQEELVNLYGRRMITQAEIQRAVKSVYDQFHPDYVESENAFFNAFRPTAFVALNDFIGTVRNTLFKEYNQPQYLISPKSIKRTICVGDANKDDVQTAVLQNKQIIFDTKEQPDAEHCYDSIGGAYSFVKLYLEHIQNNMPFDEVICTQKVKPTRKKP